MGKRLLRFATAATICLSGLILADLGPAVSQARPLRHVRHRRVSGGHKRARAATWPRVELGTALGAEVLTTPDQRLPTTFLTYFDSFTPEHEMKWFALEPNPGQFDFTTADAMVNWARAHGKTVHGHNLVWYNRLPAWVTQQTWTRASLLAVLQRHITTIVSHFRGRVAAWDVVNEPLNADGTLMPDIFEQVIGPSYIADALRWAHQADPSALLYINEYGTETINPKSNALLALVRGLLASGVPLNGIGFEMHVSTAAYPTTAQLEQSMTRFAALGLRTDVSEMDVKTQPTAGTLANVSQAEANVYGQAAAACAQVQACTRFTTWGVSDAVSWLGSAEEPLMFDVSYQPKPAYFAVINALASRR
jgi:endo-1,4-beta-xylanase